MSQKSVSDLISSTVLEDFISLLVIWIYIFLMLMKFLFLIKKKKKGKKSKSAKTPVSLHHWCPISNQVDVSFFCFLLNHFQTNPLFFLFFFLLFEIFVNGYYKSMLPQRRSAPHFEAYNSSFHMHQMEVENMSEVQKSVQHISHVHNNIKTIEVSKVIVAASPQPIIVHFATEEASMHNSLIPERCMHLEHEK